MLGVHANYCGCDVYIQSAIEVRDESSARAVSDETKEAWEALFVPSASSHEDPNRAPTVVAPSTPDEDLTLLDLTQITEAHLLRKLL